MKKYLFLLFTLLLNFKAESQNPLSKRFNKTSSQYEKNFDYGVIRGSTHIQQQTSGIIDFKKSPGIWSSAIVRRDPETGLAICIEGNPRIVRIGSLPLIPQNPVLEYSTILGINNPLDEFREFFPGDVNTPEYIYHKYIQYYQGIKVYGSGLVIRTKGGIPDLAIGRVYPTPQLSSTEPAIKVQDIYKITVENIGKKYSYSLITDPIKLQIIGGTQFMAELEIYHKNHHPDGEILAYHVKIYPDILHKMEYIIHAQTGEIIDSWEGHCSANGPATTNATDMKGVSRTINTYSYSSTYYMINAAEPMFNSSGSTFPNSPKGVIWTLDANNTDGSGSIYHVTSNTNSGWSSKSVSAHYNAKACYDYYRNAHSRNSINGQGGNIISIINVTESNGSGMDNAFWNGSSMFYGNGNAAFTPLVKALDVAGHEMTHGVVQETANLEYKNQSGAINESMADIFGCLIEGINYKMGEDITKTSYISSGCLRDLSDPHNGGSSMSDNGWQPKYMREMYKGSQDNGGVHTNSGIPNYAFYLIASQLGNTKAGKIYYRALSLYLTATSNFLDLRYAVVKAAEDLHGTGSTEVSTVKSAFDTVEIFDPNGGSGGSSGSNTGVDINANPGQDYILSYDVDYSNTSTRWFKSSTTGTGFVALTQTTAKSPVSVTDNGSKGYYIGKDAKMHKLDLTVSSNYDAIAQNQAIWDYVAVSKDGTKIAGVTTSIDSSIWIYNGTSWNKFVLYNPTTASGVNGAGVIYAGTVEWDITGQYVFYDAYNYLNNNGNPIGWWDVGMIKVWDNKTNTWGDGKVQKLFTNLPSGVNIGNPALSKNSPYILAFDYIDQNSSTPYSVIGANIISGAVKTIFTNNILSYPNYSKNDDKIIAQSEDALGDTNIYTIGLKSTKIESNGSSAKLIPMAKWGTWYSTGTRSLLNGDKNITKFSFPGLSPAVDATISGTNITATVPASVNVSQLIPTFIASPLATVYIGSTEQISGASLVDFTNPVTYTVKAQDGTSKNYTVSITKQAGQSSEKDILNFSFNSFNPDIIATISGTNITATVPSTADVTNLVATFTLSSKATAKVNGVTQSSGSTPNDFTSTVSYNIYAEDGSVKTYTVTVVKGPQLSSQKDILTYSITSLNPVVNAVINGVGITATVPSGTNVSNLIASFSLSPKASAYISGVLQTSGSTPNNFTSTVKYTVKAEDGSTKDYYVDIAIQGQVSSAKDIISFSFAGLNPPVQAIINGISIVAIVPSVTDITNLASTFQTSPKASVYVGGNQQTSGTSINNFSFPVTYTVKAEDNSTKDYVVTVQKSSGFTLNIQKRIQVYPNPSNGVITVSGISSHSQIEIYTISGSVLRTMRTGVMEEGQTIQIEQIPNGIYILRIKAEQYESVQQIVVN